MVSGFADLGTTSKNVWAVAQLLWDDLNHVFFLSSESMTNNTSADFYMTTEDWRSRSACLLFSLFPLLPIARVSPAPPSLPHDRIVLLHPAPRTLRRANL